MVESRLRLRYLRVADSAVLPAGKNDPHSWAFLEIRQYFVPIQQGRLEIILGARSNSLITYGNLMGHVAALRPFWTLDIVLPWPRVGDGRVVKDRRVDAFLSLSTRYISPRRKTYRWL